jgi:hypothetical protein
VFEVEGDPARLVECNCSICDKKGFLHWIVDRAAFRLLTPWDELAEYRFGSGVARHLFCRTCGIHSFYVPRSHPDGWSVNARCVAGLDRTRVPVAPFDGQHWEEARAALDARPLGPAERSADEDVSKSGPDC